MATPTSRREEQTTERREDRQDIAPVGNFFEFYRNRLEDWGVASAFEAEAWSLSSRKLNLRPVEALRREVCLDRSHLVADIYRDQEEQRVSLRLVKERLIRLIDLSHTEKVKEDQHRIKIVKAQISHTLACLMALLSPAPDENGELSPLSAVAKKVYDSRRGDDLGSTATVVEPYNDTVGWLTEHFSDLFPVLLGLLKTPRKPRQRGVTHQVDNGIYITGLHCLASVVNRVLAAPQEYDLQAVHEILSKIDEIFKIAFSYPEKMQLSLLYVLAQLLSPAAVLADMVALGALPEEEYGFRYEADRPQSLASQWDPSRRPFLFDDDSSLFAQTISGLSAAVAASHQETKSADGKTVNRYADATACKPTHMLRRSSAAENHSVGQTGMVEFMCEDNKRLAEWINIYEKIINFVKTIMLKSESQVLRGLASCLLSSVLIRLAELNRRYKDWQIKQKKTPVQENSTISGLRGAGVRSLQSAFPSLVFGGEKAEGALRIFFETGARVMDKKDLSALFDVLFKVIANGGYDQWLFANLTDTEQLRIQENMLDQLFRLPGMLLKHDPSSPMQKSDDKGLSLGRVETIPQAADQVFYKFLTELWQEAHASGNNFMACLALEAFSRNGKLPSLNELNTRVTPEMIKESLKTMPFPLIAKIAEILRVYFPDQREAWLDKNLKPILERYLAGLPQVQVAKTLRTSVAAQAVINASGQPSLALPESAVSLQKLDWNPDHLSAISGLVHQLQTVLSDLSTDNTGSVQDQLSGLLVNLRGCLNTDDGNALPNGGLSNLLSFVTEAIQNLTQPGALAVVGIGAINAVTGLVTNLTGPARLATLLAIVDKSPTFQPFRDQLQLAGLKANAQLLLARRLSALLVQDLDRQLSLIGDQRKLTLAPAQIATDDQLASAQLQATLYTQLATGRAEDTLKYRAAVEEAQLAKTHITRAVHHLFQVDISQWGFQIDLGSAKVELQAN